MRIGCRLAALAYAGLAAGTSAHAAEGSCAAGLAPMARVDLFFGAAGDATAWRRFLAGVVTPRFPEGLTVLEGSGQWLGRRGLAQERTHVLVVYYRRNASSDARIEAIRTIYKKRFAQASVLRADSTACVGF